VICVDLRNHGSSPHFDQMSFSDMSEDVIHLMDQQKIERAILLGHSLGGKVAMASALEFPERIKGLIVADIAPVDYSSKGKAEWSQVRHIVQSVADTDPKLFKGRLEVEKYLEEKIPNLAMRQFVVANFVKDDESANDDWKWRINVEVILKNLSYFSTWPYEGSGKKYANPSLFISGERSNYVKESFHPQIRESFPNCRFHSVPSAGHWLHADNPKDFISACGAFISELS
jgi:esterase